MRALLCCALTAVLLAVGCSSDDNDPEVAGVEIERDDPTTTSSTVRRSTKTSTTDGASLGGATTTTTPVTTTTTVARRPAPPPPPPPPTTTTTAPPPPPTVGPAQPGAVQGTLLVPEGSRARLFLVDTNGDAVVGSDELPSSGEFSFGDVAPGDYRVDTSTVASDGATSEDRGVPFQVGQATTVRLTCDPRCAPA